MSELASNIKMKTENEGENRYARDTQMPVHFGAFNWAQRLCSNGTMNEKLKKKQSRLPTELVVALRSKKSIKLFAIFRLLERLIVREGDARDFRIKK